MNHCLLPRPTGRWNLVNVCKEGVQFCSKTLQNKEKTDQKHVKRFRLNVFKEKTVHKLNACGVLRRDGSTQTNACGVLWRDDGPQTILLWFCCVIIKPHALTISVDRRSSLRQRSRLPPTAHRLHHRRASRGGWPWTSRPAFCAGSQPGLWNQETTANENWLTHCGPLSIKWTNALQSFVSLQPMKMD